MKGIWILSQGLRYSARFGQSRLSSSAAPVIDKESVLKNFILPKASHTVNQVNEAVQDLISSKSQVTLQGWVNAKPRKISKNLTFCEFRDFNGQPTQVLARDENASKLRSLQPEDAISIQGIIVPRFAKKSDTSGKTRELWDLEVESLNILNKSNTKPTELLKLRETGSSYPQEYRYLELRQESFQKNLKFRAQVSKVARNTLNDLNFTEIETPLLFKSTPEGAREFLVPTRRKSFFYALPQSPQQYKQLLMASGVKNYYQIAKCFRDEDLRADRQPEFTQIDMEMAFADAGDVREVVEKVVINIWRDTRELPLYKAVDDTQLTELKATESFPRLTYKEALFKYGIDKPDLRYTHTFIDLTEFTSEVKGNSKFPIFEVCILRDLKNKCSGKIPSEIFSDLEYRDRKPVVVEIRSTEDWTDAFAPLVRFDPTRLEELKLKLHLQEGDVIAGSTRAEFPYENPTPLGKFRQIAIKELPEQYRRALVDGNGTLIEKPLEDVFVASWVVDFPLFSPSEQESADKSGYPTYDESKIVSTHHPFTMVHLDDFDQLFTNPLEVRGEHYDLVINGVEVGGGSRRVHHPELQRYIFKSILGIEDPDILFGHLLQAFATGCPPHAGLAIGFDRMCAMLLGITSIRDVIAFPKNQAGVDAVVNSPSKVTQQALGNYHIKVAKE